jgi:hypothetical protein
VKKAGKEQLEFANRIIDRINTLTQASEQACRLNTTRETATARTEAVEITMETATPTVGIRAAAEEQVTAATMVAGESMGTVRTKEEEEEATTTTIARITLDPTDPLLLTTTTATATATTTVAATVVRGMCRRLRRRSVSTTS